MIKILKYLLLTFVIIFTQPQFAQVNPLSPNPDFTPFKDYTEKTEKGLIAGLSVSAVVAALGSVAVLVNEIHSNYPNPMIRYASTLASVIGIIGMSTTGFAWYALQRQFQYFQTIPPFVAFQCHIVNIIQYPDTIHGIPINISCNSSSSYAQALGAYIQKRRWNFGDGAGFQNLNFTALNYTLSNPGTYTIQLELTDSYNQLATGSFQLNIPDGSALIPTFYVTWYFSNPYQSYPTDVTFVSSPVQSSYPCSVPTLINWTLPSENATSLLPNSSYTFTRTYNTNGNYDFSIVAKDSSGRVSNQSFSFTVDPPNPNSSIEVLKFNGYQNTLSCRYYLNPSASTVRSPNTSIVAYQWSSDDQAINGTTTYPPNGLVAGDTLNCTANPVTNLTVVDSNNRTAVTTIQITTSWDSSSFICNCNSQ